jgi:hypothetical protein
LKIMPKKYLRILVIFAVVASVIVVTIVGLIAKVSLPNLLIMISMTIGISSVVALIIGWIFLKLRRLL